MHGLNVMLKLCGCICLWAIFTVQVSGSETQPERLWPQGAPGALGEDAQDIPVFTVYPPPAASANGAAVAVFPGGGYGALAKEHEGRDVAAWLNRHGIAALVLEYRLAPYRHPAMLQDAQRMMRTARARAAEWRIDPERIGVMGFSAGGHLASTALTHFDEGDPDADDPIERVSSRPDFGILVYPVITLTDERYVHRGSRRNLLGDDPAPELVEFLSSEKRVTPETPPVFLMHTTEDSGVPPENSILFYLALREAGIPAEMHIYEKGRHGLGLAPEILGLSSWPERCIDWLRVRGMIPVE